MVNQGSGRLVKILRCFYFMMKGVLRFTSLISTHSNLMVNKRLAADGILEEV